MNSFWKKSEKQQRSKDELKRRVLALFDRGEMYSFAHLVEVLNPPSPELLSRVLTELAQEGFLRKILRVESPAGGGIGDFQSLSQIPREIYDERTDRMINVTPDRVRVLFSATRKAA